MLRTVRRSNKHLVAAQLPTVFVTNHRSLFPKFHNFVEVMKTLGLTLGLHSEIWEDRENKEHSNRIEEALELEGIKYISNPRPNRRGGGAAITLIEGEFTLTRLEVITPPSLEVVWGLVRPRRPTSSFKGIVVCSFYSVPYSRRKAQLVEHITINHDKFKTMYKDYFFLMGGDKNDLDARQLLAISPSLHMLNTKPTYGNKNIDVMITDMTHLYAESAIIPNVPTDIPAGRPGGGQPSDHPIVYSSPRVDATTAPAKRVVERKTRQLNHEKLCKVAEWIQHETWESVEEQSSASGMADQFVELTQAKLDEICPIKSVKISQLEGKVVSVPVQKLARKKWREYNKNGFSEKFHHLKKQQKERLALEGEKELNKIIEKANEKGAGWVKDASRLAARPGEDVEQTFTLPKHIDDNLTNEECAERFASFFSKISKEFKPIEEDILPENLQNRLNEDKCQHPNIWEHEVYQNMKKAKKTDSVPGDIPKTILKEFLPELAAPVTAIIRKAVDTHEWPEAFKQEHHLPLRKVPIPEDENDVRLIGLTTFVSKQLERFLLNWMWPYVRPHMDPDQMGGVPGSSVEHYIVSMVHFILGSMDGDRDAAVLAVPVDYSKAFNRMLHSNILTQVGELTNPAVPTCAIRLLRSYLTGRSMCVRYKDAVSDFHRVPGGGPQGGLLTGLLFCVQVRLAGSPCPATTPHLPALEQPALDQPAPEQPALEQPAPPCHKTDKTHKKSYIDDLTLLEKIKLSDLEPKNRLIGPLTYHDRFNLTLPADKSILQHQLEDLKIFTEKNSMMLNKKKTKCMPFISSRSKDFMPELRLEEETNLEVIYQLKLVGLVITSDLTWEEHVNYTVERINKTIWQLTRLKNMKAPRSKLIEFYKVKIRSILMFGSVCFHSALTQQQSRLLEAQQKRCLIVILDSDYRSYGHALALTELPRLADLRQEAMVRWAVKAQASPQHRHLFPTRPNTMSTRSGVQFLEHKCRTNKFYSSAVPAMARAMNSRGISPAGTARGTTITTTSGDTIVI